MARAQDPQHDGRVEREGEEGSGRWGQGLGKDFKTEWHLSWALKGEQGFPWERRKSTRQRVACRTGGEVQWRITSSSRVSRAKRKTYVTAHTRVHTHTLKLVKCLSSNESTSTAHEQY